MDNDDERPFNIPVLTELVNKVAEGLAIISLACKDAGEAGEYEIADTIAQAAFGVLGAAKRAEFGIILDGGEVPTKAAAKAIYEAAGEGGR